MRSRLLLTALVAGCLESPPDAAPRDAQTIDAASLGCTCPADPCPFRYGREIRVAPLLAAADLSQVPVVVRLETSNHMAPDGSDLRFSTPAGEILPHEVEDFPAAGGAAFIWVGVPSLSAGADASFCMFYGADDPGVAPDPTDVWDDGFAAVWHLGETSNGTPGEFTDSSGESCNGTGGATDDAGYPQRVTTQVGFGQEFSGDDFIDVGVGPHIDIVGTDITLEAWLFLPALPASYAALVGKEGYGSGYRLLVGMDGEVLFQLTRALRRIESGPGVVQAGTWHHLAATYDGQLMRIVVDGQVVREKAATGPIDSNEVPLLLGQSNGEMFLEGSLDEVRVSIVPRSIEWVAVQHAAAVGDLVRVGDEMSL